MSLPKFAIGGVIGGSVVVMVVLGYSMNTKLWAFRNYACIHHHNQTSDTLSLLLVLDVSDYPREQKERSI